MSAAQSTAAPSVIRTATTTGMNDVAGWTVRVGDTVAIAEADYDLPPAQRLVVVMGIREVRPGGSRASFSVVEYEHEGRIQTASAGQIVKVTPLDGSISDRG